MLYSQTANTNDTLHLAVDMHGDDLIEEMRNRHRKTVRFWKAMAYTFMVASAVNAIAAAVIAMGCG